MITQYITLNMIPGASHPVVRVSQYDTGARKLVFKLRNGVNAFVAKGEVTAIIHGIKPDSTYWSYTAEINGSSVLADCTEQMTAVAGMSECEIRLSNAEGHVGSCNFDMFVEKSPATGAIISDSEIAAVEQLTTCAETAAASAVEAKQSAIASAENAENSAEAANASADNAADSARSAAESEANASGYESGAGEYADRAAREAQQAIAAAENAAASAQTASGKASDATAAARAAAGSASTAGQKASEASEDADRAEDAADRAEQVAGESGWFDVEIDTRGHLIYTRSDVVDIDFSLDSRGHLIAEVA